MKFRLETPPIVNEAKEAQKGLNWALELLIFFALYIVTSIVQLIFMFPAEIILLFTNKNFMTGVQTGNMALQEAGMLEIGNSNGYTIAMLFSTAAIILITMLFCKLIQKRKMRTLGFVKKGFLKEYAIGLLVGFIFFSLCVLLCIVTGSVKITGLSSTFSVVPFIFLGLGYMIQGMSEEVLCRGCMMISFARRYPMWIAVLVNSLFFAALHLGNSGIGILPIINLALFGIFASIYFIKRGDIWGIGAIHSIWNFAQGHFYGIKVSGMETSCSILNTTFIEGKELINGGNFGIEGGLVDTIVHVLAIVILLLIPAKYTKKETKAVTTEQN